MARLGDMCDILNGYAFKSEQYVPSGVRVFRIANVQKGYIADALPVFYPADCEEVKKYALETNDLLMSLTGNVGRVGILSSNFLPAVLNQRVACLRIKDSRVLDKSYLYHILNSDFFEQECIAASKGVAQKNMSTEWLKEYEIPLPMLTAQQSIANILSQCDTLISLRKQQLAKLDELVKARFIELFGNGHDGKTKVKMLGSICKFQQGTQIPVEEQFEEQIAGYKRFLRIIDYTQAPQPPRYVNVNGKEVDEKSVVIVRYGATAGFVGRGYQGILANNLFEIMPDETILSKEFLFLALKYGTFEKEVHDKAFGAAMPALSFSMMNDIPVVVPMPEQQSQFVAFVEQTDKSKLAIQQSLEKLENLKNSLMQKYFG